MEKISREAREINYANFARELDTLLASSTDQVLSVCEVFYCVWQKCTQIFPVTAKNWECLRIFMYFICTANF